MQTVYVAGGAGFIGSHLCRALIAKGYNVFCIDNLLTSSKDNIADLLPHSQFQFLEKDIVTFSKEDTAALPKPDFIFHLASPASPNAKSPRSFIAYPIETLQANSYGTKNLLDLALETNARVVYASTSEVYGDPEVSPQTEDYWGNVNPNGIRSVYDEGKRFGEAISMAYVRKYNVDVRIVRIFNTYGPNMQADDGRVVSNFVVEALQGKPLTIYGDGSQTRSFCYVSDMVEGLMALMFGDDLQGEIVNIGNPNETTVKHLAEMVKEYTASSSEIIYQPLPQDDPKRRNPDIAKAKRLLDWSPKVTLEQGLRQTIEYFRKAIQ